MPPDTCDEIPTAPAPVARKARPATGWAALTPTETRVARSLALGLDCREIATAVARSVKTVDTHRGAVLRKIGVDNVPQLIWSAIAVGAIEIENRAPAWRGVPEAHQEAS